MDGNGVTTTLRRDEGPTRDGTKNMTVNTANNVQKANTFQLARPCERREHEPFGAVALIRRIVVEAR